MDFQKAFDDCFETVKGYVDRSLIAIHKRIDAIESTRPERGEKGDAGDRGSDGSPGRDGLGVADAVIDREGALVVTLSDGKTKALGLVVGADGINGKDGAPGLAGKDGINGKDGVPGVNGKDGEPGEPGPAGKAGKDGRDGVDGKDIDPEIVREMLAEMVAAIPAPKDGKDGDPGEKGSDGKDGEPGKDGKDGVDGKDGRDGKDGQPGEPGKAGANGKDGLDAVSFLRSADGHLIATMSDGSTKDLGLVNGRDGQPGKDGRDGEKGADGRDGADGVGFDDLTVEHDGLRKFTFKFVKGDRVKSFDFNVPVVLDAGIYKAGSEYTAGDAVTHGGSMWIAQEQTMDKPGTSKAWRLSVKAGRDGKSAAAENEPRGPKQVFMR